MEKRPLEKWNSKKYTEASNFLKKLGYDITYKGNDKKTFRQRGVIRRLYERKKSFLHHADFNEKSKDRTLRNQEYDFAFVRLTGKKRKLAEKYGLFSKEQMTPKGVFIEKAANVPRKNIEFKFTKDGLIRRYKGLPTSPDTQLQSSLIVRLDSELLAIDPSGAFNKAIGEKEYESLLLLVNGFRFKSGRYVDKDLFNKYLVDDLIPDFNKRNALYYPTDTEEDAARKFADIFHIELIR